MNENLDIFICTHKDFKSAVSDHVYKVVDARKIRDTYKICYTLTDIELSEWYHFFYILENVNLKDYVGFCHYRRFYNFLDDVPNMDEIFKEYEIVTRTPMNLSVSIKTQYEYCHNVEDLNSLGEILKDNFNEYYETYELFLKAKKFVPCNMFIMKKDDFIKFLHFIKEFLKEWFWRNGIDVNKRVLDNEVKYIKKFSPNNYISYQSRLITFILERLTNIYILKNFSKIKTYDIILTENKYNLKNNKF